MHEQENKKGLKTSSLWHKRNITLHVLKNERKEEL